MLHFGSRKTTVKDRKKELSVGLFRAMCADLGLDPVDVLNPKRIGRKK